MTRALSGSAFHNGLLLIVFLLVGCSHRTVDLNNADNGRTINALVGDHINITLQTIGPGEYGPPQISSGAVRYTGLGDAPPPNPGGPIQPFMFEAVQVGDATVTMAQTYQNTQFTITVLVR